MPAGSSSRIGAGLGQLAVCGRGELPVAQLPGLLGYLGEVADPRDRRGVRHSLTSLLGGAAAAVLAGARSFTAIAEWIADAPSAVLAALGARRDALSGRFDTPDESTIRRVLSVVDADVLDGVIARWNASLPPAGRPGPGTPGRHAHLRRRAFALDGKALRGARTEGGRVHLMAAYDHDDATVRAQAEVDGKSNEITAFVPLLDRLTAAGTALAGAVITADALHTQREHAEALHARGAHYIFIVKKNQPHLYAQIKRLSGLRGTDRARAC